MAEPFEQVDEAGAGISGILNRGSVTLAQIESLLAQAACVRDVTPDVIAKLCSERGVNLHRRLTRGRRQLYRRYLEHCFEDRTLSEQESAELRHLRELLHLDASDVAPIHEEVAIAVYGEAVEEVLADFQLDNEEAAFLRKLREDLSLSDDKAEQIYSLGASEAHDRAMSRATSGDEEMAKRRVPAGEFTGRSNDTLEAAIADALAKAAVAVPRLHWFEVLQIAGYVDGGRPSHWHVTVQGGIKSDE
jgi:flavin-binding protein dodecin